MWICGDSPIVTVLERPSVTSMSRVLVSAMNIDRVLCTNPGRLPPQASGL